MIWRWRRRGSQVLCQVLRVQTRGSMYLSLDLEDIRAGVAAGSAVGHTRDRAGLVVLAASSADERVIIARIAFLPPPRDLI